MAGYGAFRLVCWGSAEHQLLGPFLPTDFLLHITQRTTPRYAVPRSFPESGRWRRRWIARARKQRDSRLSPRSFSKSRLPTRHSSQGCPEAFKRGEYLERKLEELSPQNDCSDGCCKKSRPHIFKKLTISFFIHCKENNTEEFAKSTYHQARLSLFDAGRRSALATINEVEIPPRRLLSDHPSEPIDYVWVRRQGDR